jgi:hypothetical protein
MDDPSEAGAGEPLADATVDPSRLTGRVTPVTASQIQSPGGKSGETVAIVGRIASVADDGGTPEYSVDDCTGIAVVADHARRGCALPAGRYVHAVGRLREGGRVDALAVHEVTDFNQIPYHALHALYAHLRDTGGLRTRASCEPTEAAEAARGSRAAGAPGGGGDDGVRLGK